MKKVQERLRKYGRQCPVMVNETRLKATVWRSREIFFEEAEKFPASYFDFFCQQAAYIRKRWWALQILVLTVLWRCISDFSGRPNIQSMMGVLAAVFAVLLVPELWKSRTAKATEVEGSTYYSLRQIYAARMLAFGIVDVGLLSIFTVVISATTTIQGKEIVIYFFLPFTVACCILFRTLCSRYIVTQAGTVFSSFVWLVVWLLVVTNEQIYERISVSVWAALFLAAVLYLGYAVKRTLTDCEGYWEVDM